MLKNIKYLVAKNPVFFKRGLRTVFIVIASLLCLFGVMYVRMMSVVEGDSFPLIGMALSVILLNIIGGMIAGMDEQVEKWKLDMPEFWDEKFTKFKVEFPSYEGMFITMQERPSEEKKRWLIEWEKYLSSIKQKEECDEIKEKCDQEIRIALATMRAISGME